MTAGRILPDRYQQRATFLIWQVRARLTLTLGKALAAGCAAVAASLARSGAEHSSASAVLQRFRADCQATLRAICHSTHAASASVSGGLHGGAEGRCEIAVDIASRRVGQTTAGTLPAGSRSPHAESTSRGRCEITLSL